MIFLFEHTRANSRKNRSSYFSFFSNKGSYENQEKVRFKYKVTINTSQMLKSSKTENSPSVLFEDKKITAMEEITRNIS